MRKNERGEVVGFDAKYTAGHVTSISRLTNEQTETVGYEARCSCQWVRRIVLGESRWPSTGKPIDSLDMCQAWAKSCAFVHRRANDE